jgi:hypothetical protein
MTRYVSAGAHSMGEEEATEDTAFEFMTKLK